jgi:hypothetical protein
VDYWNIPMECANSRNGIARRSNENGAESLFLCSEASIRLRPFLDRTQTASNNQFICWSFEPYVGRGLAELQSISVGTEVYGIELSSELQVPAPQ